MTTLLYDATFEGLMTAVFEVFEYKYAMAEIIAKEKYTQENFFAETHLVITQQEKADRVLRKLEENIGKQGISQLLMVYLSEKREAERLILSAVQHSILHPKQNILNDLGNSDMLEISKICKSVGRERHRMLAFVRFERLQDDLYFSKIEPDFNVLPLIKKHFKERYADQKWMIFDLKRHYGIIYDLQEVAFFYPDETQINTLKNPKNLHHDEEKKYQTLWQRYFTKTNIPERKNMKLHLQHVPKRYWKYLTEKY